MHVDLCNQKPSGRGELTCHSSRISDKKKARTELWRHADILKRQLVLKLLKQAFSYQDRTYLIASSIRAETGLWWRAGVSLLPAFTAPQREKRRGCFREGRRAITRGGRGFCLRSLGSLRASDIPKMNVQTQDLFGLTYIKDDSWVSLQLQVEQRKPSNDEHRISSSSNTDKAQSNHQGGQRGVKTPQGLCMSINLLRFAD